MIVGTKRDMVMSPSSLALLNNCGFDYIGSLCAKTDIGFRFLPTVNIDGFSAKKLGKAYCINFGHMLGEPEWAYGEDDVDNIDIFVKRKADE